VKERERESNSNTETVLWEFRHAKLKKGTNLGISDDFPKEVDGIRRKLYPVLKAAKREKKEAYFKVEKLLINGSLYRGPETALSPCTDVQ